MSGRRRRDIPAALARGRARFQAWRRTRRRGSRIPDSLWKLAVKLAGAYGVSRAASALKVEYYALKKRVESQNLRARSAAPACVEISPSPLVTSGECIVELEDGAGASMRVHLKGYDAPDRSCQFSGVEGIDDRSRLLFSVSRLARARRGWLGLLATPAETAKFLLSASHRFPGGRWTA
ncbi:MAG: hypothetical protein QGF59_13400 [Pirellulaceae bacterium]|nr:hypothetical protein [Pirellulaceae bacterium]